MEYFAKLMEYFLKIVRVGRLRDIEARLHV